MTIKVPKLRSLPFESAIIERYKRREIRRRTRGVGAFPDGNSALIRVAARLRHVVGTLWGRKRYLDMSRLTGLASAAPAADKVVAGQFT